MRQIFEWVDRPSVWMDISILSFFGFIVLVCMVSSLYRKPKYHA